MLFNSYDYTFCNPELVQRHLPNCDLCSMPKMPSQSYPFIHCKFWSLMLILMQVSGAIWFLVIGQVINIFLIVDDGSDFEGDDYHDEDDDEDDDENVGIREG